MTGFQRRTPVRLLKQTRVTATGAGDAVESFADAAAVTVTVNVKQSNAVASGSIALLVEHSADGDSWETLADLGTVADPSDSLAATVADPNVFLRLSWTVSGAAVWYVDGMAVTFEDYPAGGSGGGGGGGGSLPLSLCYLEMNTSPNDAQSAAWDTIYDRRGFPHTLAEIPAEMGLALDVTTRIIEVQEAGLWSFMLMAQPTIDATAHVDVVLSIVGDYSGGPRIDMPDVSANLPEVEACLPWTSSLVAGDAIGVQGRAGTAIPPTAPDYKPLGYCTLTLIRLG